MISRQQKAYILALAAILLWSTAGSAFKLTLDHISASQLLLFAAFFSMLFLFAWKAVEGKLAGSFRISRREWLNSAIMGLLNPFAYYIILFEAYDLLLAQEAVALNYVWPVTLVLLSIPVLKQKIGIYSILALLVSFAGLLIIIMKGSFGGIELSSPRGIFFALISSVFWASFWVIYVIVIKEEVVFTLEGMGGSLYVGLFEMGLTYVLWLKALQLSSTTARVSNLVYISPFLSLMFVSLTVGETIYLYTIGGLVLIVGGIVLQRVVR